MKATRAIPNDIFLQNMEILQKIADRLQIDATSFDNIEMKDYAKRLNRLGCQVRMVRGNFMSLSKETTDVG